MNRRIKVERMATGTIMYTPQVKKLFWWKSVSGSVATYDDAVAKFEEYEFNRMGHVIEEVSYINETPQSRIKCIGYANGTVIYAPQYKGWFRWRHFLRYESDEGYTFSYEIGFDTSGQAIQFIQEKMNKIIVDKEYLTL